MTARRYLLSGTVTCLSLGCLVGSADGQPPVDIEDAVEAEANVRELPAAYFDQAVFGRQPPKAARDKFDLALNNRIREVDQACSLTAEQAEKLRLAGRIEIERLFDEIEVRRQKFHGERRRAVAADVVQELRRLRSLISVPNNRVFRENSLLDKVALTTLSDEQRHSYEAELRRSRAYRQLTLRDALLQVVETKGPLIDAQRKAMLALLEELPPVPPGPYEDIEFIHLASQLPEERYQKILDAGQWMVLKMYFDSRERKRRQLQQLGMLQEDVAEK